MEVGASTARFLGAVVFTEFFARFRLREMAMTVVCSSYWAIAVVGTEGWFQGDGGLLLAVGYYMGCIESVCVWGKFSYPLDGDNSVHDYWCLCFKRLFEIGLFF